MKSLTFNRSALRLSELESRLAPAITLIASGNWDNPEIWQGGIPTNSTVSLGVPRYKSL
jgi:hypothetical protein